MTKQNRSQAKYDRKRFVPDNDFTIPEHLTARWWVMLKVKSGWQPLAHYFHESDARAAATGEAIRTPGKVGVRDPGTGKVHPISTKKRGKKP